MKRKNSKEFKIKDTVAQHQTYTETEVLQLQHVIRNNKPYLGELITTTSLELIFLVSSFHGTSCSIFGRLLFDEDILFGQS